MTSVRNVGCFAYFQIENKGPYVIQIMLYGFSDETWN
jgi:hypothetical protein